MFKVKDVLDRVHILLEDEEQDIWTREELVMWANDAVLSLTNKKPDAYIKKSVIDLVEGTYQSLPEGGTVLVRVLRDMGTHRAVTGLPFSVLDDQNPNWRMPVMSKVVQHYAYDDKDRKHFEVYPSVAAGVKVEILHGAVPERVSLDDDELPLGEEFINIIVDWTLYRAWSKDDEAGDVRRAQMHLQAFMSALGIKSDSEQGIMANTRKDVGVQ
ncbi:phage adaptor protein [Vibrio parahaemolyticus]|uniref:phage adaptor protein n=1 Tax=Vibrio parahaemolyticus TaxID=670 RepID=UPI00387B626A